MQTEGLTPEETSQGLASSLLLLEGPAQSDDTAVQLDMKQRILGNVNALVSQIEGAVSQEDA
jgi:hypothetical protein